MRAPGNLKGSRRAFLQSLAKLAAATPLLPRKLRAKEASPSGINVPPDAWPWWRGPNHDNIVHGAAAPLEWNRTKNILWRAVVPGRGHASPSIWGNRIF